MSIFEAFETPKDLRPHYETSPCTAGVMGLKTLNVICGPNNSGKSRLLRALVQSLMSTNWMLISSFDSLNEQWQNSWDNGLRGLANHLHRSPFYARYVKPIEVLDSKRDRYDKYLSLLLGDSAAFGDDALEVLIKDGFETGIARTTIQNALSSTKHEIEFAYVPAIRTARDIGNQEGIHAHVSNRYFEGHLQPGHMYGGQELYARVRQRLLGRPKERQRIREFEHLLSEQFFDGREVSLSPREEGDNRELHIRIEPETDRAVSLLGDGLQSIIIQLAPAFLSEGKHLALFIEEPELYLHPGLQRRLFEVLLDLNKYTHWERHQVFVTSHSNHLLDLTLDHERIAILRVEKAVGDRSDDLVARATAEEDARFKVEMVAPGEIRLLHDLGVQSSSVFLSNCTIWVEGPTDRTIIRHYMELIAKRDSVELREDLDFSFVYYAGSLAERLSLLDDKAPDIQRMCSKLFFIADKDITTKGDRAARLEAKLGDRFHLLGCREIENSVSAPILRDIVAMRTKSDAQALPLVKEAGLADAKLGKLLNKTYEDTSASRAWAATDGGVSKDYKSDFADLVCTCVRSVEDMTPAAIAVAEAAVAFVRDHRAAANTPGG